MSFFGGHNSGTASMATAGSAEAATTGVRGGVGLCSCAITMTTAINAGVRGGIGLCSCAVTMATAVSAGVAIAGVRGGVGLCSYAASVITLVTVAAAKTESWNAYMVNDHIPAFLKPLTALWTDVAFLYATLRISVTCHVVIGLPTCFLIHILNASSEKGPIQRLELVSCVWQK